MVYDWDDKRETCYRMYVQERKTLDEIIDYFRRELGFVPSRRAFQTQFKRWDFPLKQNRTHKNEALIERVRQLWESNTMQKDMVPILTAEGFTVTGRELMRIRAKYKWFLRRPNGNSLQASETDNEQNELSELTDATQLDLQSQMPDEAQMQSMPLDPQMQSFVEHHQQQQQQQQQQQMPQQQQQHQHQQQYQQHQQMPQQHQQQQMITQPGPYPVPMNDPGSKSSMLTRHQEEEILDRRERYRRRKMDSDTNWQQTRKRRRHTADQPGFAPEPAGPPRYPSETTLGEVQSRLHLDKTMYWDMRSHFENICRQRGIIKKTACGPEAWQGAKDLLVQQDPHLTQVFQSADQAELTQLQLSLDVVCMDVTKHIRNSGSTLTLAEAKNILGINPDQARDLRDGLMAILAANNFINTFESDNLPELKEQWMEQTGLKTQIPLEHGPDRDRIIRAINLLAREIMKRWREEQARRDPSKASEQGSTSKKPAAPRAPKRSRIAPTQQNLAMQATNVVNTEPDRNDEQIDPSLLMAANNHSLLEDTTAMPEPYPLPDIHGAPIPAYFRLHPMSSAQGAPTLWLGALGAPNLHQLHAAALSCRGGNMFHIGRIEGVVGSPAAPDMMIQVDHDDELQAYLDHVGAGKATFVVLMHQ